MNYGTVHKWKGDPDQPTLVCLHGFMGHGSDFSILANSLKTHSTIVAPNFPDFTIEPFRSEDPWTATLKSLDDLIEQETNDATCILLGYSMGGRIALQYALRNCEKIKGLILIGATPGIPKRSARKERTNKDQQLATELLGAPIQSFLESWNKQSLIETQERVPEPYLTKMREARLSNNKEAVAYYLNSLGTGAMKSAWNQLSEFHLPTLIVTGEEDKKFTEIAEEMSAKLPKRTFKTISRAGHAACFEQADAFAEVLKTFLEELEE